MEDTFAGKVAQLSLRERTLAGQSLLIYGSYGYSGALIARRALDRGLNPILAGRDNDALLRQNAELGGGLEHRTVALDDEHELAEMLTGVGVVLHCAGPFRHTSRPMADACLRSGVHYLDITAEIAVFESLAARDAEACAAGVMLLPGVGFDVVPSDCLAVHLAQRLPGSTHLTLAFQGVGRVSRGTRTTVAESVSGGSMVRREGKLLAVPLGSGTRQIDFGRGPRLAVSHPWGDLATAYRSTGIPNIEVYRAASAAELRLLRVVRVLSPLLGTRPARQLLRWAVRRGPAGPDETARRTGFARFWGETKRPDGARASALLHTPEAYTLTARTAIACAERALQGEVHTGFATPALAYGADLVLSVEDVRREDVD